VALVVFTWDGIRNARRLARQRADEVAAMATAAA
jgi:hypothetical protein